MILDAHNIVDNTLNIKDAISAMVFISALIVSYITLKLKQKQMEDSHKVQTDSFKSDLLAIKQGKHAGFKEMNKKTDKIEEVLHERITNCNSRVSEFQDKNNEEFKKINEKLNIIIGKLGGE